MPNLKPRPSGEVAASADGEGYCRELSSSTVCSNFFFQAKKKEAKKSLGHLRLCPGPRNAFWGVKWLAASRPQRSFGMRENKRLFYRCRDRRPRLCVVTSFFRRRKKKQKSRRDTCDCVPDPATLWGGRKTRRIAPAEL